MHKYFIGFLCLCVLQVSAFAKKNVLLVVVDDLNDWVGAFGGHPQANTPNLDRLAAKGVRFQKAYSSSPVCKPSRTAFLTGRRPHETGIDSNGDTDFRASNVSWLKNVVTLPQYFSSQGYLTESVGKIFHKPADSTGEFDNNAGKFGGASKGVIRKVDGTKIEWSEGNAPLEDTSEWRNADYGAKFLGREHDKPFFLAVGIFRPHLPWYAPKPFFDAMPDIDDIILPPYLSNDLDDTFSNSNQVLRDVLDQGGEKLWKETVRAYLANSHFADAAIGRVLSALEDSQYEEDTIVAVVGDHGWHLGEKNHYQKFTNWEVGSKTHFIIYDPSTGVSGDVQRAVSLQDLYLTLTDLAGVNEPEFTVRGRSLKALVENPLAVWEGAALVTYNGVNSVYSDRFHLIEGKGGIELYDLERDPNEWNNVADTAEYAAVRQALLRGMERMLDYDENPFVGGIDTALIGDGTTTDGSGEGENGEGTGNTPDGTGSVVAPLDLKGIAESCTTVKLTWSDNGDGEMAYRVRRKLPEAPVFTNIGDTEKDGETFTDFDAQASTTYIYAVRPLNALGIAEGASNLLTLTTPSCAGTVVANQPPSVEVISPLNGAVLNSGSNIVMSVDVDDDNAVLKARFFLDGVFQGADTTAPYAFNFGTLSPGVYEIMVEGVDSPEKLRVRRAVTFTVE